jgi:hypothetical protein
MRLILLLLLVLLFGVDNYEVVYKDSPKVKDVTWSDEVKGAVTANCLNCHGEGKTSPDLSTAAKFKNSNSKDAIESGRMPKGSRLSSSIKKILLDFLNGG